MPYDRTSGLSPVTYQRLIECVTLGEACDVLEGDCEIWRAIALAAIDQLHTAESEVKRLTAILTMDAES